MMTENSAIRRSTLLCAIIFVSLFNQIECEVFTNPPRLINLFLADSKIAKLIEDSEFRAENGCIESFLQDRKDIKVEIEDALHQNYSKALNLIYLERMTFNPIHVFKLIKRTWKFSKKCFKKFQDLKNEELTSKIAEQMSIQWPTNEDLIGSIHGLLRPQYTYYLSPLDIARGILGKRKTFASLSADDCLQIGKNCLSGKYPVRRFLGPEYASAIEWIEAALILSLESDAKISDKVLKISQLLEEVKQKHDENYRPMSNKYTSTRTPNEEFFIRKFKSAIKGEILNSRILRSEEREEFSHRFSTRDEIYEFHVRDFNTVCRGEPLNYEMPSDRLIEGRHCYITDNGNPYLKLAPAKVEIVLSEPPLYVFYDAITEAEIKMFKVSSALHIERSRLENKSDPNNTRVGNDRTQSNAWIWDEQHEQVFKISKRLDLMTGLQISNPKISFLPNQGIVYQDVETSEAWQIGAYGPGGLYYPHYDSFAGIEYKFSRTSNNHWVGNRIATAMAYLSDVDGGGTGFPILGKATFPKKGSFAFWFNLHRNGNIDKRTLHGACPTIFGIKWVANKWIREGPQMLNRPCDLRNYL